MPPSKLYGPLKSRLIAMAERDNQVRTELAASGELFGSYNSRMAEVHADHAHALDDIIAEHGWPGETMVGRKGAAAAWLILQHAIGLPDFQRRCLALLIDARDAGEVPVEQVAYLEDRICVLEGRPQRYGTQLDWDGHGQLSPQPVQDPERVDDYRSKVGLPPLAEAVASARLRAEAEGDSQPEDFEAYCQQRDAWARSVGWR